MRKSFYESERPGRALASLAAHGFGLWGARLRRASELVGFGGFWAFRDPPVFELLFGVARDRWGVGLATELAGALVRYGTEVLGWSELRASTDAPNRASIRVLEKLGFQLEQRAVVRGLDTLFYRLCAPRHLTRACSRRADVGARFRLATARRERATERKVVCGPARGPAADAQVVRRYARASSRWLSR